MRLTRRRQNRQRGSEIVEFAITLPFLAMLLLVVGQVSAAVSAHQILCNSVREGARLSAVPGEYGRAADVQNAVAAYAQANGISVNASAVTVNQNELVSQGGDGCSASAPCLKASLVSVTYQFPLSLMLGKTMTLGAAVEMRNFY
ncbi:MAG: TadE/TadG family type IV pilus assembly protein [Terriglobales bacterium]